MRQLAVKSNGRCSHCNLRGDRIGTGALQLAWSSYREPTLLSGASSSARSLLENELSGWGISSQYSRSGTPARTRTGAPGLGNRCSILLSYRGTWTVSVQGREYDHTKILTGAGAPCQHTSLVRACPHISRRHQSRPCPKAARVALRLLN